MNVDKIVKIAMVSFLTLATTHTIAASSSLNNANKMEKCYGIAKASMNDCQTATASCAGSATKDSQNDAFLFLPKGLCTRIVGGNLKPESDDKK